MEQTETVSSGGGAEADPLASAKEMAGDAGRQLQRDATDIAASAKQAAQSQLEEKKGLAAEVAGDLAAALHKAGEELDTRQRDPAASLAHKAADGLTRFAHALSDKRPGELVDELRSFARANPMAFAAGSALAGFAIGRLLRGALPEAEDDESGTEIARSSVPPGGAMTTEAAR